METAAGGALSGSERTGIAGRRHQRGAIGAGGGPRVARGPERKLGESNWLLGDLKLEAEMELAEKQLGSLQEQAEFWTPQEALNWGLQRYGQSLAIASSFGAEDVVLIDVASRLGVPYRVFTLDTDFLFPETYALIEQIEKRYGIAVERAKSELTPETQASQYSAALWASKPDQCCQLRKVDPLKKHLAGLSAWVTG